MKEKETIGELIRKKVYQKNMSVVNFAEQICYTRENVYKIFKRNSIDIDLLARISKVLDHNFFADLAENYKLAEPVEEKGNRQEEQAVTQFFKYVPEILRSMEIFPNILIGGIELEGGVKAPDFILYPYGLTFTLFETYEQRFLNTLNCPPEYTNSDLKNLVIFEKHDNGKGTIVTIMTRNDNGFQTCDILLDKKTKEEWEEALRFAFEIMQTSFFPATWGEIRSLLAK